MIYICFHRYETSQVTVGETLLQCYEDFKANFDSQIDLDELKFFEVGEEIEVKLELVAVPKAVKTSKLPK